MNYDTFLNFTLPLLTPKPPSDFYDYVYANPQLLDWYADMLMYTLPLPRYKWYQPSNFQQIQNEITAETNKVTVSLGFYQPRTTMQLLQTMQLTQVASLTLGLLFGIIVILFVVISILLIYSLLMISVETKTFETGVLRMIGLDKKACISMILIQSLIFVVPSIIFAYFCSIPCLAYLFKVII